MFKVIKNKIEESKLTSSESLQIITDMIGQAKRNLAKNGSFYFLLWGWVGLIGNFGFYIIAKHQLFPYPWVIWSITLPATIVTVIYSRRQHQRVTTSQFDNIYLNLWIAIIAAQITVLIVYVKNELQPQCDNFIIGRSGHLCNR